MGRNNKTVFVHRSVDCLCVKVYKKYTKKPLELINEFSKIAEYKVNVQNSVESMHEQQGIWNWNFKNLQYKKCEKDKFAERCVRLEH